MRHLILLCALLIAGPAQAADEKTQSAVTALTDYCLPAVKFGNDVAKFAHDKHLTELSKEEAMKFSPEGGRAFALPDSKDNAVLMMNEKHPGTCAIAVHSIKAPEFWSALDKNLSGFSLMRERRNEEDKITKREYSATDPRGSLTLLITAADGPRPNGIQALITLARIAK